MMRSLQDLDPDALRVAHDAADVLIKHRDYLPGGLLLMMVGRFRDDIRDALGPHVEELPLRERGRKPLGQLTSLEFDMVRGAVIILLQPRFTAVMDDPELPRHLEGFQRDLDAQQAERDEARAPVAS